MNEHRTERLSAYLDGELNAAERQALETHLAHCAECAGVLADLERIVAEARGLEDRLPEEDLWPEIARRLQARVDRDPEVIPLAHRRKRFSRISFTIPQLAAAALALIVVSGGLVWLGRPDRPAVSSDARGGYADATAELERAFEASRDRLDPETVRTVETNIAIIDAAIAQTLEALEADPNSIYLYDHLTNTRQRKLEVLRDAAAIVQVSL
ncbi:MAG TPA: zf-HC2 domain-containing protein [Gemmatimonadota bacterium]|nr:zf-HC2 domain-containing protein [Gemmatimonadota bacterium]